MYEEPKAAIPTAAERAGVGIEGHLFVIALLQNCCLEQTNPSNFWASFYSSVNHEQIQTF